jgi:hypothetical protein
MSTPTRNVGESVVKDIKSPPKEDMRPPSERRNNLFRDCPKPPRDPSSKSLVR